jgi:SH3 domain protein
MEISKKMKKSVFGLIILSLFFFSLTCHAQNKIGYVSDMLLLSFREGPGNNFSIIKTLKSNTPVEVLEDQNGFLKVKIENDETGWVKKQYIIFSIPKTMEIKQLKNKIKGLEEKTAKMEMINSSLEALVNSHKNDAQKLNSLEIALKNEKTISVASLSESQKKYNSLIDKSRNINQIINENKMLSEEKKIYTAKLERLEEKNKSEFKTGMVYWFLAGAGILLFGWIIGHTVSLRRRQPSSLLD